MRLFLAHHGKALAAAVDAQQPLSDEGRVQVERVAAAAAARGARPGIVWHSGKLRARQTAQAYWRACNSLAPLEATRDLQPADAPEWLRDRLRAESRDVLIVGHFPYLPRLLTLLVTGRDSSSMEFPEHGIVALSSDDGGETWTEIWRIEGEKT